MHEVGLVEAAEQHALVDRAIRGDGSAFTRLYDLHVGQVYRYVFYRVGNVADTEDLTQETFLRAWRAVRKYRPGNQPFLAWLYTIAHHLVIDHYRQHGRRPAVPLEERPREPGGTDPALEEVLEVEVMRGLLADLPAEWQQVIMMRFVEGLDHDQVAVAVGKSPGAVRVIQHRALRQLRQFLERRGSGDE